MAVMRVILLCLVLALLWGDVFAGKPKPVPKAFDPADFNTFGVLLLDAVIWEKVIPNNNAHTLLMVSNKASIGKQTTDRLRNEFIKTAHTLDHKELLIGQVIVNGAENSPFASRLGVPNPQKMPHPYFFIIKKGETHPIPLQTAETVADLSLRDLAQLMTSHTGVRLGLDGTSPELDDMANKFIQAEATDADRTALIAEAEAFVMHVRTDGGLAASTTIKDRQSKKADQLSWYVQYMKKIADKGLGWAVDEKKRLEAILESDKVSDERKKTFISRVNVIGSFCPPEPELVVETTVSGEAEGGVRGTDGNLVE